MDAVGFSESAPPLYYALAWLWTQVTGTGEFGLRSLSALAGVATVPVAYLLGAELRGRRAGLVAAALVAVNPMLLWYSQEARAYALLRPAPRALAALLRARAATAAGRRDLVAWGDRLGAGPRHPLLRGLPDRRRGALAAAPPRPRRARSPASGSSPLAGLLLAPLAIHQMSYGHAEWIGNFTPRPPALGDRRSTFVVGETGDIIAQPEHPLLALRAAGRSRSPRWPCSSCARRARRAPRRGDPAGARRGRRRRSRSLLGAARPEQGLRARPQPAAGAGAAAGRGRDRLHPAGARRRGAVARRGCWSPTRSASASGPASRRPCSGPTGTRSPAQLGEPTAPRAMVTWTLARPRCATTSRPASFQVRPPKASTGCVARNRLRLRRPGAAAAGRACSARASAKSATRQVGRALRPPLRAARPGPGAAAPARARATPQLDFRTNGVLLDGIGPG